MSPRLAALLGYDPHRVADLRPELQRALALSALAAFPGIVLLAGSAAYGAFLASDVVGLSVAVGLGAGLYLLNLLRVAVAGGGVGPQQPLAEVTHWMPRTVPLVMLALLGLFFAQPLILGLLSAEQDPTIEELRRSLGTLHAAGVLRSVAEERTRAVAALAAATARFELRQKNLASGADARSDVERATATLQRLDDREAQLRSEDVEPYQRHLQTSHFLQRRVQLTWERPVRPALLSWLMVLFMV